MAIRLIILVLILYVLLYPPEPAPLPVEYRWNLATPYAPRVAFSLS